MRVTVTAKKTSAISGDCLVLLHQSKKAISVPHAKSSQEALKSYGRAANAGRMKRLDSASPPTGSKVKSLVLGAISQGKRKNLSICYIFFM